MTSYKIIVAYNGAAYHGWQWQSHNITVVQVLQDTFYAVFKQKILISGASRTDAGVHALGQVATFSLDLQVAPESLKFAWNNMLPADIVIKDIKIIPDGFNPRRNVRCKTYKYYFFTQRPMPLFQHCGWFFKRSVNFTKLYESLQVFVGEHDFRSFCTGYDMKSTIRKIYSIHLEYDDYMQAHVIVIKGPGFLRYMIRRIVGACLTVASKDELSVSDIKLALERKNPEQTLPSSPAKGLLLYEIEYEDGLLY